MALDFVSTDTCSCGRKDRTPNQTKDVMANERDLDTHLRQPPPTSPCVLCQPTPSVKLQLSAAFCIRSKA